MDSRSLQGQVQWATEAEMLQKLLPSGSRFHGKCSLECVGLPSKPPRKGLQQSLRACAHQSRLLPAAFWGLRGTRRVCAEAEPVHLGESTEPRRSGRLKSGTREAAAPRFCRWAIPPSSPCACGVFLARSRSAGGTESSLGEDALCGERGDCRRREGEHPPDVHSEQRVYSQLMQLF